MKPTLQKAKLLSTLMAATLLFTAASSASHADSKTELLSLSEAESAIEVGANGETAISKSAESVRSAVDFEHELGFGCIVYREPRPFGDTVLIV